MDISRRILMTTAPGLAAGAMIMPAASAAASPPSVLATDFGLKPNSTKDQSRVLQSAVEAAVKANHLAAEAKCNAVSLPGFP